MPILILRILPEMSFCYIVDFLKYFSARPSFCLFSIISLSMSVNCLAPIQTFCPYFMMKILRTLNNKKKAIPASCRHFFRSSSALVFRLYVAQFISMVFNPTPTVWFLGQNFLAGCWARIAKIHYFGFHTLAQTRQDQGSAAQLFI